MHRGHRRRWIRPSDADGVEIESIPCPIGHAFRAHLVEAYACQLEATGTTVWIDDDLRLDNHGGSGFECFCPDHLRRFEQQVGTYWPVEQLAELLERNPDRCDDEEIELRQTWRMLQAEGLAELCQLLAERAAELGGDIARMTPGGFGGHLRTGVDLDAELRALQVAHPMPAIRFGGAVYSDDVPLHNLAGQLAMDADAATVATPCRPYTEVDTFPGYPGQKSAEVLTLELTTATAGWGADHTLAILPSLRRLVPDEGLHRRLAEHRHHLTALRSAIAELLDEGGQRMGASQPVTADPAVTARLDLTTPATLPWNNALARLGVPVNPHDPRMLVIDADTVRAWTPARIEGLIAATPSLLTVEALHLLQEAETLTDCGVSLTPATEPVTYEVEEITLPGEATERAMAWFFAPPDVRHVVDPGPAQVWSTHLSSGGQRSPGLVVLDPRPGRAAIAVTTHQPGELRDPNRQRLFQRVYEHLTGEPTVAIRSALNVLVIHWHSERTDIAVLANYGHTTHDRATLALPDWPSRVERLEPDGRWAPVEVPGRDPGSQHRPNIEVTVPGLAAVTLRLRY